MNGKRFVFVEGNIGIGKTTVMQGLKRVYANDPRIRVVQEPVDKWLEHGFLQDMYAKRVDKGCFQLMVLMSLVGELMDAARDDAAEVIVMERSIWTNYHVFAKSCVHMVHVLPMRMIWITLFAAIFSYGVSDVLTALFSVAMVVMSVSRAFAKQKLRSARRSLDMYHFSWLYVQNVFPDDMDISFVLLSLDHRAVLERMRLRNRESESAIDVNYLYLLEQLHEEWAASDADRITVVDASASTEKVLERVVALVEAKL